MKLFRQQDDQGTRRKSKTPKLMRRFKNKRERKAAKQDPDITPGYGRYKGWVV